MQLLSAIRILPPQQMLVILTHLRKHKALNLVEARQMLLQVQKTLAALGARQQAAVLQVLQQQ